VIGLGGNIGTAAELIDRFGRARQALALLGEHLQSAPLFRTAPLGPQQAPFLNTAVRVVIEGVQPDELIASVLEIERLLGRTRDGERNGPRLIDLDVLIWGTRVIRMPGFDVPHPRLRDRRFALEPVVALLGEDHALPQGRVGDLLDGVRDQACEQIADHW